jgi:hypothetical protein
MRYLLIGNAPDQAEAVSKAAERADIVLQIDHCRYAEILPRVRANYVFLTNAGATAEVWSPIMNRLLSLPNASVFQHDTRLILARNPAFYAVKKSLMRARGKPFWRNYSTNQLTEPVARLWPSETISFYSSLRLEFKLHRLGKRPTLMPSTGLIAYDWLRRRWQDWDYIGVEGFTFVGWDFRPWTSNALRALCSSIARAKSAIGPSRTKAFRASGLSLITAAAIVHWNTVYLHRAVQHSPALGAAIPGDLLAHVAPWAGNISR